MQKGRSFLSDIMGDFEMENEVKTTPVEKSIRWLGAYRNILLVSIGLGIVQLFLNISLIITTSITSFVKSTVIFWSVILCLEFVARLIFKISTYRALGRFDRRAYVKTLVLLTWEGIAISLSAFVGDNLYASATFLVCVLLYFGIWWLPNFIYFRKRAYMFNKYTSTLTTEKLQKLELHLKECVGDDIFVLLRDRMRERYRYKDLYNYNGQCVVISLTHNYVEQCVTISDYYNYDAFLLLQELIPTQTDKEQKSALENAAEKVKMLLPFVPSVSTQNTIPPVQKESEMQTQHSVPKNTPFIAVQEEDIEESKPCSETTSPASQSVEAEQKGDLLPPPYLHPFAETAMEKAALQMYEEAYQKAFHSEDVEKIKNAFDRLEYIVSTDEFSSMRTKAEKTNTSNSVKSKQKKIIVALSIVCAVFLISTVALSIATYAANQKSKDLQATVKGLKDENFELQKDIIHKDGEIDDLTSKYNRAYRKANFLDEHIAFVTNPYADYYHTYSCPTFQNADSYWAYNIEAAEANGYSPCPRCH